MKTIAVAGATGAQGSSVVQALLETGTWKIRGITRNVNGAAAKKLQAQGVEVVTADYDDEESLITAFRDVNAVFAMTNFWEHVSAGKSVAEAAEIEERQGLTLARAAAKTATLEHYIWSTLPATSELTNGEIAAPHCDSKARVDNHIRQSFPDLAAKTTYLWYGFYPQNLAFVPPVKVFKMAHHENYIWMLAAKPSTLLPITGDIRKTSGLWVRRILENPHKTLGKYAGVVTEVLSLSDIMKAWSRGTGKPAMMVECSSSSFYELWGHSAEEFRMQLVFHEREPDMIGAFNEKAGHGVYVTAEDLGITAEDIGELSDLFKELKDNWV